MTKIIFITAETKPQGAPSLGVAYLASYLRSHLSDIDIKIFSFIPEELSKIVEFPPDIICISSLSPQFDVAIKLSRQIKEKIGGIVIVGGHHITNLPSTLPQDSDIGVIGEGEETLLELISLYQNRTLNKKQLRSVKGIVFRNEGKIVKTGPRNKIEPLDRIPYPSRDLLDMEHFLQVGNTFGPHFGRGTHMFSSRGCPYNCIFCASVAFWGRPRLNSPEYVLGEIKSLIDTYSVELIHIYDDLFLINKNRLAKIADLVVQEGIHKKVKFGILGRIDLFDDEICKYLKRMNVIHVNFGAESGNQRVLQFLKNDRLTIQQTRDAVNLAKKYGFTVDASFIIGSPGETEEEVIQTLEFIKSLKLDKFSHFIATPYPGTHLWEVAKKEGIVSENMDWSRLWMSRHRIRDPDGQIILNTTIPRKRLLEIWEIFEEERLKLFNYRWEEKFQKNEN